MSISNKRSTEEVRRSFSSLLLINMPVCMCLLVVERVCVCVHVCMCVCTSTDMCVCVYFCANLLEYLILATIYPPQNPQYANLCSDFRNFDC